MKILSGIDIPFNPFGGSPIICDDWYSNLPQGQEILFLTMPPQDNKWWHIPNIHFLKTTKIKNPNQYPEYISNLNNELENIINSYHPDIIHMQHLNFGLSRSFVETANSIPKIGICHGTDTQIAQHSDFFKNNLIQIADNSDMLVFPAELMAQDFFSIYKKKKDYEIIPHGIPSSAFAKNKHHQPTKTLKLLYAGRLNSYKGTDIAVEAVLHVASPVSLDIIGNEDETGYKALLESMAINSEKVIFHNSISRSQLWNKFADYDCILIPSRSLEAFSLTAVEAQARGLVVIYGNGGGIKSVIGNSGICIVDNSSNTLKEIIEKVNSNRSILLEYRKRGYKNAQRYKLYDQIASLLRLSEQLINRSNV